MQQLSVHTLAIEQLSKNCPAMGQRIEATALKVQGKSEGCEADPRCLAPSRISSPRPVTRGESFPTSTQDIFGLSQSEYLALLEVENLFHQVRLYTENHGIDSQESWYVLFNLEAFSTGDLS